MTPGQRDAGKYPCNRAVEYGLPVGQRKPGTDRASEHEDPVDPIRERLRPRKPWLENQQQRGTDGRHGEHQEADSGETDQHLAPPAARTEEEQKPAEEREQQQVAGLQQRPQHLAEDEAQVSALRVDSSATKSAAPHTAAGL